jgi:hypothetical protein
MPCHVTHTITQITGFSLGIGMLYAMDTLCSQAYGAKNFAVCHPNQPIDQLIAWYCGVDDGDAQQEVGYTAQRAVLILACMCVPIAIFWQFTEPLLLLLHQEQAIARLSGQFTRYTVHLDNGAQIGTGAMLTSHNATQIYNTGSSILVHVRGCKAIPAITIDRVSNLDCVVMRYSSEHIVQLPADICDEPWVCTTPLQRTLGQQQQQQQQQP